VSPSLSAAVVSGGGDDNDDDWGDDADLDDLLE
jgi:hypothetical protein